MRPQLSLNITRRDLNVFIACLLSFSLLMMPFVQVAAASRGSDRQSRVNRDKSSQATKNVTAANAPLPAPAPQPLVATVTATKAAAILNDDGDLKADPAVSPNPEKIEYTVTVSNTGTTDATNVVFTDTIDAHTTLVNGATTTQPIAVNDTYSAIGNVRITVPDGASDLLGNDCDPDPDGGPCTNAGLTISVLAGDNSAPFAGTSTQGGNVTASATDGSFQYNPAPGFEGSDSFTYTTVDATGKTDTATVNITVSGMIWFVNAAAPAGGDGRLTTPFSCLVGTGCFSGTTLDEPGDFIFLFSGTYNDTAALVMLNNQKLIGAAAGASLASITGFTIPPFSDALPATGGASPVINSTASGIQLASGNLLRGFTVGNTATTVGNYDILNTATATVGTLNILEVILNGTGGLFRADSGGVLNVSFPTATTTSAGSNGVHIGGVISGSVSLGGGSISGVVGADVAINGGTVALTVASTIAHAANSATVDIANHSGGTVTFSAAVSATNGTGLQFNNADGTYNFNGATTLSNGDAGIDIVTGSSGTFNFGGTSITNPSGVALNVSASSGAISISGAISKNTDGKMIDFDNYDSGTATISGNLSCTSVCDGIEVTNDGAGSGTVNFSGGTKTLTTGASTAVHLDNIDGGNVNFTGGGLDIDTTSGVGFNATNGGTVSVTTGANNNTIDTDTGTAVNITGGTNIGAGGMTLFSITVDNGVSNSAANAIVLNGTTGAFLVTGDGSQTSGLFDRDGSGGTINRTTGHSVLLTNAQNVTLRQMNITNTAGAAAGCPGACTSNMVNSTGGSNIVLSAILFQNPSGHGWYGTNLSGTNRFDNNGRIQNWQTSNATGITIDNTNTNFTLFDVRNSVFTTSATGADGFLFDANGATTGTINVISNEFTLIDQDGAQINNDGSGTITAVIQRNNFHDSDATGGDGNNTLFLALSGTGNLNFTIGGAAAIDGNAFTNTSRLQALAGIVQVNAAGGSSSIGALSGSIQNNTITNPAFNAARRGIMIAAEASAGDQGAHSVLIANNSVQNLTLQGIYVSITSLNGWDILNTNFSINNNAVGNLGPIGTGGGDGGSAIEYETNPAASNTSTNFSGNLLIQGNTAVSNNNSAAGSTLEINNRHTGGNNTSVLNVTVLGNSLTQSNGSGESFELLNSAGDGTGTGPSTCLDLNSGNVVANRNNAIGAGGAGAFRLTNNLGTFAIEGMGASTPSAFLGPRNLTNGASPATITAGGTLGVFTSSAGCANSTAAPTSLTSEAAAVETNRRPEVPRAIPVNSQSSVAAVTATSLPSANSAPKTLARSKTSGGTTLSYAPASTSRFLSTPAAPEAKSATKRATLKNAPVANAVAPAMAGETVTINIGTLRPGDSVTITFQVTVNNPPNLSQLTPPQVTNQGTVNFNDGATPLSVNTNTVNTPVDLFNTTTTLASDLNPSNFGDLVTFTATVAEDPTQATADPTGTVDFIDTSNGNAVVCNDVALTSGSAQCQTSTLTAGLHNIRADYSGDGNFDPSQSNIVAQTVNACTPDPIVTTTADAGAGSLREAIANVCSGDTITFNIAGAGPHTISLTSGELVVAKNVTINNNSGEKITVSGGGLSRVFNINPTKTAAIIGLTISGGDSATAGGGVLNDGTLTIVNSTLSGNSTDIDGGAISNSGPGVLTLINTTISGNSAAGNGGGVVNLGGTVTSVNSTISDNRADSDANSIGTGGGIHHGSGTTTLHNTIVAGNFNEDGVTDAADDISGTVNAASSFNLIGTGGAGGLTNGVNNNQVGVANAGLGPLADNGGLTQTHALLSTSSAVETGGNANLPADTFDLDGDADMGETLPVDQRGLGFPRNADSQDADAIQTVDIGAFELHPSVEDITDKSTAEDTLLSFSFNLGDGTGSLIQSVTATSGNQTLVPDANISVTGSGSTRTLNITPALNANTPSDGTATITVTVTATNGRTAVDTFVVTVTEVNDNPVATDDVLTAVDEDSGTRVIPFATLLANDSAGPANESTQTLTITNVSNPVGGTVVINGMNVEFTLAANFFGTASFDYTVTDNGTTNTVSDPKSDIGSVSFTVNPINDPPSFTIAADPPASNEDGGPQTVLNFATAISAGPNEVGQILTFNLTPGATTGTLTFSSGPAIDATTGTLTYTATADTNGTAIFSVTLSDNGSNTPPNSNTSAAQQFTITVNAQNDAPIVTTTAGNLLYTENAAATAIDPGLTVTDGDSPNLASATVAITSGFVPAEDTLGFTNQNGITGSYNSGTGVLTLMGTSSVANYQTALSSVTYQNSSDNPTLSRTVTFTANDGTTNSAPATRGIAITAVNDAPMNTVPGPQGTNQNTPLTFSSGNGNQISVADVDAGSADIRVTLTATNGTITLATTAGLSFGAGDGTADPTMTFDGTLTEVNTAMNGMTYTPDMGFSGAAMLTITSNDLGNSGTGGPLSDTDVVNIQVATNISIQDASVVEPKNGSVNMIFTVTLSAPAPAGGASVDFTTQDQAPALNHATAGQDYTATSGTVNFAAGEQFKTILVQVLSDNKKNESSETFLVVLSNPMNATIADGTATGTIIENDQAGAVLISEIRTSGPAGATDEFVEIYNNSSSPHTVNGTGGGYGVFKMGATCSDTPVLLGVIPNGTVIPSRGHYLFTGSAYSLADYGGTGAAAGDAPLSSDIENDRNVAIFSTASLGSISSANRLDAVGFGANTGGTCDLFREGATLPSVSGSTLDYSFVRDECGKKGNPSVFGACPTAGLVKDSNVNNDDFIFIDTTATATPAGQRLGAPGPQNLGSPHTTFDILALLLDSSKGAAGNPNRVRDTTAIGPNAAEGTMSIRRRFVNNTGAPVTKLRIRVVDISTAPVTGGTADLRVLSSSNVVVSVNDSGTCTAAGFPSTPCNVTVLGTTLETPPAQPLGGGHNSSVTTSTITLGTPLAPGASINLQFLLGVQTTGGFKFFFNIEALP